MRKSAPCKNKNKLLQILHLRASRRLAEKEGFVPRRKPKGKRSNTVAERYVISFSRSRSETTALQKEKKKKGCRFCNLFLLRPHASSRFGGERGICPEAQAEG